MDPLVLYLLCLFSLVLLALAVQKVRKKLKKIDSAFNLPKGPIKIPIIGNLHNLVSSQPHQKLRDLARKYGPLMHLQLGEISTVIISSPDSAREVMKTHDINFAIRPQVLASVLLAYNSTGEELDMTEQFGVTVNRKDDILLSPFVYRPLPVM
ncbi:hypothetical protein P8452_25239 [Trifolium repens]|nr:hypothetical protein P8452_25239 [Trifolium repens]